MFCQKTLSPVAYSCGLLNHLNDFCGGMFKLNAKLDADLLLYSLSHFECNGLTVHMIIQWHLLPPLTSTVKSSLFTHVYSNLLSLAARLHQHGTNCSHYINNGWSFSGQISYNEKIATIKLINTFITSDSNLFYMW